MILTKCGTFLNLSQEVSSISISRDSSYKSRIVWVSSSEGIVDWEAISNLGDSIGITVSFTLAKAPVANSTIAHHMSIAIVYASDNTTKAITMSNLADGVGITVTMDTSNSQEDKCKSSHVEQSGKTGHHQSHNHEQ